MAQSFANGHCGATVAGDPYDCSSGSYGAFVLPDSKVYDKWPVAIAACLHACASCERCNYVSVSTQYQDCSWYSSCGKRQERPTGFRTVSSSMIAPRTMCFTDRREYAAASAVQGLDARVLWLTSIRLSNAFEAVCTLLSGVLKTLRAPSTIWRPRWLYDDSSRKLA